MDYRLNLGTWKKVFAVPAAVAEDHLKLASGTQIKVLLFLLAHSDLGLHAESIAEAVGTTPADVDDALLYWKNADILSLENGELYPSEHGYSAGKQTVLPPAPEKKENPLDTPEARVKLSADTEYRPKEIAAAVNGSTAVKFLFETYEKLAGKPPNHSEQTTLMVLVEQIGLPCEVTMMLVEYCFTIGLSSADNMKKRARDWCENGIIDIPKAEELIRQFQERRTAAEESLRGRPGIPEELSVKQKQRIAEWAEMGISTALINEAYDNAYTRSLKEPVDDYISYMNGILRRWNNSGITDPSQTRKDRKTKTAAAPETSYDLSVIEQQSLDLYKDLK